MQTSLQVHDFGAQPGDLLAECSGDIGNPRIL